MARQKFQKLTFSDIQKINWANADLIRDKGNGKNEDTPNIVFPLITLKRFMDLREEHKIKHIRQATEYFFEDENLVDYIKSMGFPDSRFKVAEGKESWYDIEWEDILRFQNNKDGEEREIHLGDIHDEDYKHRLTIKTSAKTQTDFLFEVIESFESPIIKEMLIEYNFENTFLKVIPSAYRKETLDTFKDVKYYLEYADEDVFGDVYMDITGRFASLGGKKGGEFFTPTELTKALVKMRNPKIENNKDYILSDLTAGACTFMVYAAEHIRKVKNWSPSELNKYIRFVTQEKEKNSEIFGKLNLAFHGYNNHTSYHANSILDWKKDSLGNPTIGTWENKADCILANPPYGLKDYGFDYATENKNYEKRWEYGVPPKGEGEYAFILSIINLLNAKGEAAIVLPLGTQFKDSTKNIRQRLIEEGLVEAIVNLPANMFLTTGIPVCAWFLKKGRTTEEQEQGVYFMDASECFEKDGKNNKFIGEKADNAILTFLNKEEIEGLSKQISLDILKENNFNLSATRYVFKEEEKEHIDIKTLNYSISKDYQDLFQTNKKINELF